MLFVAPGTEELVLRRVAAHLRPDGFAVIGFAADRGYELPDFDRHAVAAGLVAEQRFATWDLRPWRSDSPFSVSVLRRLFLSRDQVGVFLASVPLMTGKNLVEVGPSVRSSVNSRFEVVGLVRKQRQPRIDVGSSTPLSCNCSSLRR
jgi:hypothetical protein